MDAFVADQYSNKLPKQDKPKNPDISIASTAPADPVVISTTNNKTTKFLPLILYWQYDYRHTVTLNPSIPVSNFIKTLNSQSNKALNEKLSGQKLQLTIEEIPNMFALADKGHLIWLVYVFKWNRIFIDQDTKDLVVSYKLERDGNTQKTGKITIRNTEKDQDLRFFQGWKSAVSEQLGNYNVAITKMTRDFVNKLLLEL